MRNFYIILKTTLLFLAVIFLSGNVMAQNPESTPVKGIVRVKLTQEAALQIQKQPDVLELNPLQTTIPGFNVLNKEYKATSMKPVFHVAGKFAERQRKYGLHLWYEIAIDSTANLNDALSKYGNLEAIEFAESKINYFSFGNAEMEEVETTASNTLSEKPNDPLFYAQWHYENTGQTGGTPGADINLLKAWKLETGNPEVVVAVIDGGIDYEHEDLAANMWTNEEEIPENGIDDDNNGYIDDYYGWNFVMGVPTIIPHQHGTHVAGTIAAVNNNNKGVAGVAGGSGNGDGVRLMSCQVFSTLPGGTDEYAGGFEEAFIYAADNGATISNNSWGGGAPSQAMKNAILYYIDNAGIDENGNSTGPVQEGGLPIFAAGNFSSYSDYIGLPRAAYPSAYGLGITVANTNHYDQKSTSSYFSEIVDICAPGDQIYSTLPGNQYGGPHWGGTSMASPHVTGVAALIASKYAHHITPNDITERLLSTAKDIYNVNPTFTGYLGKGRLDAYAALVDDPGSVPAVSDWGFYSIDENTFHIGWMLVKNIQGITITDYEILVAPGEITDTTFFKSAATATSFHSSAKYSFDQFFIENLEPNTTYTVAIQAKDRFRNTSGLSQLFSATTWKAAQLELLSNDTLEMNIDVSKNNLANDSYNFRNKGEAFSRYDWNVKGYETLALKSASQLPSTLGFRTAMQLLSGGGNISIGMYASPSWNEGTPSYTYTDSVAHEDLSVPDEMVGPGSLSYAQEITYESWMYANKFVAEHDMVLSHVGAYIATEMYDGSQFHFSIHVGGEDYPAGEPVASTGSYIYDYRDGGWYKTTLSRDVEVKQGDIFWVTVTAPRGLYLPIGAKKATGYSYQWKDKSFARVAPEQNYMTDIGQVFGKYLMIRAYESVRNSSLVKFTPRTGDIQPDSVQQIDIEVNGNYFDNGTHLVELFMRHDDPKQGALSKFVKVNVSGQAPQLEASMSTVDFGTQFFGTTESIQLEIKNTGKGNLKNIVLGNLNSDVITVSPSSIAELKAGYKTVITLTTKKQDNALNYQGLLKIVSDDGSLEIPVLANFIEGPVLEGPVSMEWLGENARQSGEVIDTAIVLKNVGNYPASYSITAYSYIQNITPASGIIMANDSISIQLTVDLNGKYATSSSNTTLNVNYDGNQRLSIPFKVEILGEPQISIDNTSLDFGNVIAGSGVSLSKTFTVTNTGTANAYYSLEKPSSPFSNSDYVSSFSSVSAGSSKTFTVSFAPQDIQTYADQIVFNLLTAQNGTVSQSFPIELLGKGDSSPLATYSWTNDFAKDTLAYGNNLGKSASVTITNDGNEKTLNWSVSAPEFITIEGKKKEADGFDNGYGYSYNYTDYEWIDITGKGTSLTGNFLNSSQKSTLIDFKDFIFRYYGNDYSSLTIGKGGWVSFDPSPGSYFGTSSHDLPNSSTGSSYANAVIAPFWGNNVTFLGEQSDLLVYETDEYVVIQWNNVGYYYRGDGGDFTFQLILYANGDLKYQYKEMLTTGQYYLPYYRIGFEGPQGIYGVTISEDYRTGHDAYSGKAILINPPLSGKLAVGESKIIQLQYISENMAVGDHSGTVNVLTNDINNSANITHVALHVSGESNLAISKKEIAFEDVMYLPSSPGTVSETLLLINTGSKAATVASIEINGYGSALFATNLEVNAMVPAFDTIAFEVSFSAKNADLNLADLVLVFDDQREFSVKLSGDAVLPPVFAYDLLETAENDTMKLIVNENGQNNFRIQLANQGQEKALDYSVTMGILRQGWGTGSIGKPAKSGQVFADSLNYDIPEYPMGLFGGDGVTKVKTATLFTVTQPEGFTLTHVKDYLKPGATKAPYIVKVMKGNDLETAELLYSGEYHAESSEFGLHTIALSQSFYFEQGSQFFIEIDFPVEMKSLFGFDYNSPSTEGKYWISYNDGAVWEELPFTYTLKTRALSAHPGQWLTIEPRTGEIEAGAAQDIDITVDASLFEARTYQARMNIAHNDPLRESANVPVLLRINSAPVLQLPDTLLVTEGEVKVLELPLTDPEGDEIISVEETSSLSFTESHYQNGLLTVTLTPDYFTSGDYILGYRVTDTYGASKEYSCKLTVVNTNRAPEVVTDLSTQTLHINYEYRFNFGELFADPDNDTLTYTIYTETNGVVEIFTMGPEAIIVPVEKHMETMLHITATDIYGKTAETGFIVSTKPGKQTWVPNVWNPNAMVIEAGTDFTESFDVASTKSGDVLESYVADGPNFISASLNGNDIVLEMNPDENVEGEFTVNIATKDGGNNIILHEIKVEVLKSGNTVTGLDDLDENTEVNVYPNPARELIHISGLGTVEQKQLIRVFNSQGSIVYSQELDTLTSDVFDYNVTALKSGTYHIQIISANKSISKTFVKL
ncbi:S8 family serine peptidase [Maribellus sp. CM-23]|uniref:S8 family serine peptidase n=1 Tax=Maribellus sp. CM-23 TaxID=2781026 RepID=UPI001F2E8F3F|nr:S8 family serine peptidase [Maribellus sp. CM-23]MCE4565269.1 S8 family serine peptidase [Maribellus sp. CM-23]